MMRTWMTAGALVAIAAGSALAQSPHATVSITGPHFGLTPGEPITLTVYLDYDGLPPDALGLAGWNIAVDVTGGAVTGATYLTGASPLSDQNDPFFGDPVPTITGNTVHFNEGLNALTPANGFHTGGALATITIDTTGTTGQLFAASRLGDGPVGAFTYAQPSPNPAFSYVGTDFDNGSYGRWDIVPTPGSVAVLVIAGGLTGRRRRARA